MNFWLFILTVLLIQTVFGLNRFKKSAITSDEKEAPKLYYTHFDEAYEVDSSPIHPKEDEPQVMNLPCPLGCVCQSAHFKDLPISRWINHIQSRKTGSTQYSEETSDELINGNESVYDADESFIFNPLIKQATCILNADSNVEALVQGLPDDLQALIILYTGIGMIKTVNTSTLKPLNQLNTLEIRGSQDRNFRLILDEPLRFLQNVNFEYISLVGSDNLKHPENMHHPSDSFDYKPKGEFVDSTYETFIIHNGKEQKLGFESEHVVAEILPYDVYKEEERKARMPCFYGWEHMEVLRIHSCQLNELDWEMFEGLEALQHLSLERNEITVVPAFALYGAMHIKSLSLAHNNIQDLHYRALAGLLDLELLDLSHNRLSKLSELTFPPFPHLKKVDFTHNPLRYIFPATFWVMNATEQMVFGSKEVPLELWGNLPFEKLIQLKELNIGNVSINNLDANIFKTLSSLEKLVIRGEIRSIEFDAFSNLNSIRELDLSNCQIREISMDALMGCRQLQLLNLSVNKLSYLPPGIFDDQLKLKEIYLESNQLTTLPINFFLQPQLQLARLHNNPWICSCDMQNWLPKVCKLEKRANIQRCVTDFQTGKQILCKQVPTYESNQAFTPRCQNYYGRSVFYVMRKELRCGNEKVLHIKNKKTKPHWLKVQEKQRKSSNKRYKHPASNNSLDFLLKPHQQRRERNSDMEQQDISNEIY